MVVAWAGGCFRGGSREEREIVVAVVAILDLCFDRWRLREVSLDNLSLEDMIQEVFVIVDGQDELIME